MAPNDARNMENDSRNPGLTPIDNGSSNINRAGKKHEPDSTTGRLPERAEKKTAPPGKKSSSSHNRWYLIFMRDFENGKLIQARGRRNGTASRHFYRSTCFQKLISFKRRRWAGWAAK
jgi:hypothetical protein